MTVLKVISRSTEVGLKREFVVQFKSESTKIETGRVESC